MKLHPAWFALLVLAAPFAGTLRADQMDDELAASKTLLIAGKGDDAAVRLGALQAKAQAAVDATPTDHHALYILGSASMLLGDDAVATAALGRAVRFQPDNLQYALARAQLADMQDKPADAVGLYKNALAIDPKSLEAWTQLGLAQRQTAQFAAAQASFEKAAELAPKDPKFPGMIAQALADQHKNEDAIAMYNKAIAIDPKYAAAYSGIGQVEEAKGDTTAALAVYSKAVELSPDDFRLIAKQVQLNETLGNTKERNAARDRILALQKAGKVDSASYCREIFQFEKSPVMAFEYFTPDPPAYVHYAFNLFAPDGKTALKRISLGINSITDGISRIKSYQLDAYSATTHEVVARFPTEPTYEQTRDAVQQYLAGKLKPLSTEPMPTAGSGQ
jgi:cytochrome c-type biogenesis protein CcmH/NrfG